MKTCVMGKLQLIAYFENILNSTKVLKVLTLIYLQAHFFVSVYIEIFRERGSVHFSTLLLLNDRSQVLKL